MSTEKRPDLHIPRDELHIHTWCSTPEHEVRINQTTVKASQQSGGCPACLERRAAHVAKMKGKGRHVDNMRARSQLRYGARE